MIVLKAYTQTQSNKQSNLVEKLAMRDGCIWIALYESLTDLLVLALKLSLRLYTQHPSHFCLSRHPIQLIMIEKVT